MRHHITTLPLTIVTIGVVFGTNAAMPLWNDVNVLGDVTQFGMHYSRPSNRGWLTDRDTMHNLHKMEVAQKSCSRLSASDVGHFVNHAPALHDKNCVVHNSFNPIDYYVSTGLKELNVKIFFRNCTYDICQRHGLDNFQRFLLSVDCLSVESFLPETTVTAK